MDRLGGPRSRPRTAAHGGADQAAAAVAAENVVGLDGSRCRPVSCDGDPGAGRGLLDIEDPGPEPQFGELLPCTACPQHLFDDGLADLLAALGLLGRPAQGQLEDLLEPGDLVPNSVEQNTASWACSTGSGAAARTVSASPQRRRWVIVLALVVLARGRSVSTVTLGSITRLPRRGGQFDRSGEPGRAATGDEAGTRRDCGCSVMIGFSLLAGWRASGGRSVRGDEIDLVAGLGRRSTGHAVAGNSSPPRRSRREPRRTAR